MTDAIIRCFDGLVPAEHRSQIMQYALNSKYRLGWRDVSVGKGSEYKSVYSSYTKEDLDASGLGLIIDTSEDVQQLLDGYELSHCIVNLSLPMDTNYTHTHGGNQRIVLYYANLEWESAWYGETLFFNDTNTEIIFSVRYTPGRILVFDGSIPHSIRPQSLDGPQYRFTIATVYKPKQ